METQFKLEVREETKLLERTETLRAKLCGYDVLLISDRRLTRLCISPSNWQDGLRLGILDCHPKTVGEIEKFAEISADLFRAIAAELRNAGKDDLRSESEKQIDAFRDSLDKIRRP